MQTFNEDVKFNGQVVFLVLPSKLVGTLIGATPSVKGSEVWKAGGLVVTITNFQYGADGQRISILGDGNTTVSHNANIKTNTAANKLLAASKVYTFTLISNVWYENA